MQYVTAVDDVDVKFVIFMIHLRTGRGRSMIQRSSFNKALHGQLIADSTNHNLS